MSEEIKAYIAGFLDGDGCLMAQLVKRPGYIRGYQIRLSIVFYQKQLNINHLVWLKNTLKFGYIRNRNDGMAEYTIVGANQVASILKIIYPHLKLKKKLAKLILQIAKKPRITSDKEFVHYCNLVDQTAQYTYSKKRTRMAIDVKKFLTKNKTLIP